MKVKHPSAMLLNIQSPHELFSFVKPFEFSTLHNHKFPAFWHFRSVYAEYKQTGIFLFLSIILKQASLAPPFRPFYAFWKETNVFSIQTKLYLYDILKGRKLNLKKSKRSGNIGEGDGIFIYVRVRHGASAIVCQLTSLTLISDKTPLLN